MLYPYIYYYEIGNVVSLFHPINMAALYSAMWVYSINMPISAKTVSSYWQGLCSRRLRTSPSWQKVVRNASSCITISKSTAKKNKSSTVFFSNSISTFLNINETESESVFAFDMADRNRMPISGRYVSLGNNNYLLCNNVRYENLRYPVKEFAFPIKINIYCKTPNALTPQVKLELLTQVYQFSRIYWKSVSQQNLPVTIMYPKMIAEIMPHFCHKGVTEHIPNNRLWFL